ncbi:formate dehydrogenase subunit delta [Vreelandella malpeensis]|uniref:Formate dehydrogenase subunit delta n=1 Tax=Vreelandella malpeensis TaxID=1172368 RepID=A0ABS8DSN3_9GAMM|nr:formate dehydrogenase subunit delta [Halomonas malpeensis]MCB8889251.1 formate dehydrogenase subunit delta [Halomonas malpeensis]
MSAHPDDNLISMLNQIALNLGGGRDEESAATATCRHVETFWARPMKQRLMASLARPETGLSATAHRAATLLAKRQEERRTG